MSDHGARRSLFDELVRQRICAEQMLASVDPTLDPAAISEKERRERDAEEAKKRAWAKDQDSWLASMVRLLPAHVRPQAQMALGRLTAVQVRERLVAGADMAAWRRMEAQQIHGMRALLRDQRRQLERARQSVDNLVAYVVRAPRADERIAVAKRPAGLDLKGLLEGWRDPQQLRIFLSGHSDIAPGSDRAVDLARSVATRRSQLLARMGQKRVAASKAHRLPSHADSYYERLKRGREIQEIGRPKERTKRNQAMPKGLAQFHATARRRALRRSLRWWRAAHGLACAHTFAIEPISIAHGEGARVIFATGIDCTSPELMALSFISRCKNNKASDLLHLMVSLPAGFADREDIDSQLLYHDFRLAARLGYDLKDHVCTVVAHSDRSHPHHHIIIDKTRISDGARISSDASDHWRALNLENAILTKEFTRSHGLPDDENSMVDSIGGFDKASLAASARLEKNAASGKIRHTDGSVETIEIYSKAASSRIMAMAGTPTAGQLPGGIAKTIPIAISIKDLVEYVTRNFV